jgi:carbonic anhydrase
VDKLEFTKQSGRSRLVKMTRIAVVPLFMLIVLVVSGREESHSIHWSYDGENGPSHWGDLSPDFSTCKSGLVQSPINIKSSLASDVVPITFEYSPSKLKIIDNGHTVQVNYQPGSFMMVGEKRYELKQFHFHHPSEEQINGRSYALVAHLVHADDSGRLAVVAVLFTEGQSNPLIKNIFSYLPKSKENEETADVTFNVADILPRSQRYLTFPGSLTTPPCTEGVTWFVLETPTTLSSSELAVFARLYPHNARPVQPLNDRKVLSGR